MTNKKLTKAQLAMADRVAGNEAFVTMSKILNDSEAGDTDWFAEQIDDLVDRSRDKVALSAVITQLVGAAAFLMAHSARDNGVKPAIYEKYITMQTMIFRGAAEEIYENGDPSEIEDEASIH